MASHMQAFTIPRLQAVLWLAAAALAGCNAQGLAPSPVTSPTAEQTSTPEQKSSITVPTTIPSPAVLAADTSTPPMLPGVETFVELVRLGSGTIEDIAVNPASGVLATVGSEGLRLYRTADLGLAQAFEKSELISVAWSPNRLLLATGSTEGLVEIMDSLTGQTFHSLTNLGGAIVDLSWSPDGHYLAALSNIHNSTSGGYRSEVLVWEADNWTQVSNGKSSVYLLSLTWSPDGTQLAVGSQLNVGSGLVSRLHVPSDAGFEPMLVRPYEIAALAWSPDGARLAVAPGVYDITATPEYRAEIVDATQPQGSVIRYLSGHTEPITSLAWSPDGAYLASGAEDREIRIWNALSGEAEQVLKGSSESITSVAWAGANRVVSSSRDAVVRLWNTTTGTLLADIKNNADALPLINALEWSHDGQYAIGGGRDGSIFVWRASDWQLTSQTKASLRPVNALAWSPKGDLLLTGTDDNVVGVWSWPDLVNIEAIEIPIRENYPEGITSIAWSGKDELVAIASRSAIVQVWDAATWTLRWQAESGCSAVAWSPNGEWLACATGGVDFWTKDGTGLITSRLFRGVFAAGTYCLAWFPDNDHLVLGSASSIGSPVYIMSLDGESVTELQGPLIGSDMFRAIIAALSLSPDGRWWALGDNANSIQLWDAATNTFVRELEGHIGPILSLQWSPDSAHLISSSEDGTVRVWGRP